MTLQIVHASAQPCCLPTLAEWHHREWAHLYADWTPSVAMAELQSHVDANASVDTTWLALHDNHLCGSVSLIREDAPALKHLNGPWLASLWVHPEHRRHGLGARLVKHVLHHAQQHALTQLRLFTVDGEAWYRALGWQFEQRADLNGSQVVIMRYPPALDSPSTGAP